MMLLKWLKYGLVVGLLAALVGGTIWILARPAGAQAVGSGRGAAIAISDVSAGGGSGYGQGSGGRSLGAGALATDGDCGVDGCQVTAQGGGYRGGQGAGGGGYTGGNTGSSPRLLAAEEAHVWETVQGTVTATGNELTVATADGEVVVGLGQAWYLEAAGFTVVEDDEVVVQGYYEDGEFKAGKVENLTSGASIALRDESGRPMWAGRGNRQALP